MHDARLAGLGGGEDDGVLQQTEGPHPEDDVDEHLALYHEPGGASRGGRLHIHGP